MTPTQKRIESRAIDAYLRALEAKQRPTRGRRTREWLAARQETLTKELLPDARGTQRLLMTQELSDVQRDLEELAQGDNLAELQGEFVKAAASYSQRHNISFETWRQVGVSAAVLNEAGVQ